MRSVSGRPCPKTWTGEIWTAGGRLPDLKAWVRRFREQVGQAFIIRGVEATVEGRLVEANGQLALRLARTGEVLRLTPLRRKVQWDPDGQREAAITGDERSAYERLAARWTQSQRQDAGVRVVGPLVEGAGGDLPALEVRGFVWPP